MADYYSILKKTIEGVPNNTPEIRQAVYKKARSAIEAQLRGIEPPLEETAVLSQLQSLEEAIFVVDAEYALPVDESGQPIPAPSENDSSPDAQAAYDTERQSLDPEPIVGAASSTSKAEQTDDLSSSISEDSSLDPIPEEYSASSPDFQAETPREMPRGESVIAADGLAKQGDGDAKTGGSRKLIAALVIAAILGGGGYAIWANKDTLQPMLTSLTGSSDPVSDSTEQEPATSGDSEAIDDDTATQVEKEAVKLGDNGEDQPIDATPEENEETVELQPEETPLQIENEDEASSTDSTEDQTDRVTQPEGTETGSNEEQAPLVGEVAYLYEEGSAGSGATRTNAAIAWALKRESIAEGLPPEQVITGSMEVPEKNLTMDVEIKRNVDNSLSASHIIELKFSVPDGFSGGGIDNISRFVMKSTEEARGEPLVAVPVKVSDGFFLIALDNLQQAQDVNTQLLLESSWIDVPVSYSTGKRALVTLEKGGSGEQVFREAFQDWKNR